MVPDGGGGLALLGGATVGFGGLTTSSSGEKQKRVNVCCKARKTKPNITTKHIINTGSFQKSSNFLRLNKKGEKTA